MKIGFIGLGIMGKPMSKNLLKAGYALVVLDRNSEAVEDVVAAGAERASSPKAVAEQCEVIITMLPNSPHVKEVVLGENGVIEGAKAGSVVHAGDIGAGNVTKLANQVIVALNIAAMSEALVLVTKAGVDPELVYKAVRGGLAGSTVLDAKAPMVLDRNFKPGFRIDLHIKDLANALDTSHGVGAQLPLTAAVMEMMQALKQDDLGSADHSALACYYEKLAHVVVKRQ